MSWSTPDLTRPITDFKEKQNKQLSSPLGVLIAMMNFEDKVAKDFPDFTFFNLIKPDFQSGIFYEFNPKMQIAFKSLKKVNKNKNLGTKEWSEKQKRHF